ncbi:MAG: TadE/TadG family type IV pilus assembly protein [Planctomycetota bacterium]|nr:TadE/TadG family type IV pilus assembly protein [Planctomycetota bacterium]MDP7249271.1 TadE/TadG family type IV pilus assembly protein [Planctomycetota bacterium]
MSAADKKMNQTQGQALVEFTLVAPIQLLLILVILQVGQIVLAKNLLNVAGGAAARAVLVEKDAHNAAVQYCSFISPKSRKDSLSIPGWNVLDGSSEAADRTQIEILSDPGDAKGEIRVLLTHRLKLAIPLADVIFADETEDIGYARSIAASTTIYKSWSDDLTEISVGEVVPDVPLELQERVFKE